MATKTKPPIPPVSHYLNQMIVHSSIWIPVLAALLSISLLIWPKISKYFSLSKEFEDKKSSISLVSRSNTDLDKVKKDFDKVRDKAKNLENRLPSRMKTTLIIETLQEITKQSKLKFTSLEPAPIKKYTLEETNETFVELPVRVRLNCGYWDLIDFLKKIESAGQLMKITDLNVKDDPSSNWEHSIDFSISAYSKGGTGD